MAAGIADRAPNFLRPSGHEKSRQVARLLGAGNIFFYNLPDNRFDTWPLLKILKILEELIHAYRPEIIYTHHPGDLNIDHALTHRAVLTATRPLPGCPVKAVYAFEVPSSTEWAFGQLKPVFRPNIFMDIQETLDVKLQAMQLYESELQPFPHPRSVRALQAIARRWGSVAGLSAAEAFELIREVR